MRDQRLVFGEVAELYDRSRPSYPPALVDDVANLAGPGARVVEVGCGTGKASVMLAARGLSGVGVEPDPAMAAVARRNLAAFPGWTVEEADFEAWEGPAGRADLVCAAQSWHWIDPAVRLAKAYELLRPGGVLALWWNRPGEDRSPVRPAIDEAYRREAPQLSSDGVGAASRPPAGAPGSDVAFGPGAERTYAWSADYTTAEWIALMRTQSSHRLLPPEQLERLLVALAEAIDGHGGVYRHPYVTRLWTASKPQRG